MNEKVIGVVGGIGSGKDEVLKYLKAKYGIPYISTGDIVRRIAESENKPPTRENLKVISMRCFQDLGKGCFIRQAGEEITNNGWRIAGISGVRSPDDVDILRQMFGSNFVLVRVDISDPQVRFQRLRMRNEERDPIAYNQFVEQDANEEKTFRISVTGSKADFVLNNDGSLEDLHRAIDALVSAQKLLSV